MSLNAKVREIIVGLKNRHTLANCGQVFGHCELNSVNFYNGVIH